MDIKTFKAGASIPAHRFVKFGTNEGEVVLATSAEDTVIGVSDDVDTDAGNEIDIYMGVACKVQFGGAVAQGDGVVAGANGKAVKAAEANAEEETEAETPIATALASCTEDEIDYIKF